MRIKIMIAKRLHHALPNSYTFPNPTINLWPPSSTWNTVSTSFLPLYMNIHNPSSTLRILEYRSLSPPRGPLLKFSISTNTLATSSLVSFARKAIRNSQPTTNRPNQSTQRADTQRRIERAPLRHHAARALKQDDEELTVVLRPEI